MIVFNFILIEEDIKKSSKLYKIISKVKDLELYILQSEEYVRDRSSAS
jgi:hypothetical protein